MLAAGFGRWCVCWFHLELGRGVRWIMQPFFGMFPRREGTNELDGAKALGLLLFSSWWWRYRPPLGRPWW